MDRPAPTINISIPRALSDFVRERMRQKGFGNTSEYFRHLVREDQARAEQERIERLLVEGLESGPPGRCDPRVVGQAPRGTRAPDEAAQGV